MQGNQCLIVSTIANAMGGSQSIKTLSYRVKHEQKKKHTQYQFVDADIDEILIISFMLSNTKIYCSNEEREWEIQMVKLLGGTFILIMSLLLISGISGSWW